MSDKRLLKIIAGFRRGILGKRSSHMMCFAVCAPLPTLLQIYGFEVDLINGSVGDVDHYWLKLPDGRIVDPTADQFSTPERPMPPVYIGALPEWYEATNQG